MDNIGFPQTRFDFLSLQNALQNTAHDGRVVSPTNLDWEHSSYSDEPRYMDSGMDSGSYGSLSSAASTLNTPAINTPCIGTSGITTPEDLPLWDPALNWEEPNSAVGIGGQIGESQQRWIHRVNSLALPGYLETYHTNSHRSISLSERSRSLNSIAFDKNSCDFDHGRHLEPPKIDYENEDSSISSGTGSPIQHISGSISKNCKRKSAGTVIEKPNDLRPVKKTAHNMIEKRYRNKLNDSIAELRDNIPSLRLGGSGIGKEGDQLPKLYKATVITKAVEHISNLEKEISRLMDEVDNLRSRIEVQKLTPAVN